MKRICFLLALLAFVPAAMGQNYEQTTDEECTSIVVGRLASTDGSVMTSHTCDGVSHTWVTVEPAARHKPGDRFLVYKGLRKTSFPGDTTDVRLVGSIPEAPSTFAYLNTGYPSLNEKQLAIGETTFTGPDTLINNDAMFLIEELARLALMRCDNARDAIRLMGATAEQYGYGDGGECLTVADKNEVWFFEICGVGKDRTGAVWAAQRVPDDHVSVSANIPRIGRIDRANKDYFMCSDNVESVAREFGLWDGEGDLIFWKAYNVPRANGHNFKEREWFILNALAPSLGLSIDADELPFSVKPDAQVDVRKVMEIFRSTYEGTDLDMCKNWLLETPATSTKPASVNVAPGANPWLTTDTRNTLNTIAPGTIDFKRTVAVAWCAYSTVLQLRNWLPDAVGGICWLAADNPGESPRIPIFAGTTRLPAAFDFCGHKKYRADSFLWTFRRANRLATVAWQTDKQIVQENILKIEDLAFEGLKELEKTPDAAHLNAYTEKIFNEAAAAWQELEAELWHRHGRGF